MLALVTAAAAAVVAFPLADEVKLSGVAIVLAGTSLWSAFMCSWYCLLALLPRLDTTDDQDVSRVRDSFRRLGAVAGMVVQSLHPANFLFGDPFRHESTHSIPVESGLYFGALANADANQVADVFRQFGESSDQLRHALAAQILALSRIATIKYRYLQFATAWLLVAATVVPVMWLAIVLERSTP